MLGLRNIPLPDIDSVNNFEAPESEGSVRAATVVDWRSLGAVTAVKD